jgi:hypothetical protein
MSTTRRKTGNKRIKYRDFLYGNSQLGPFPTHLLKRVGEPTNRIVGPIERRDPRESVFGRSARGDYGETIKEEFLRMTGPSRHSQALRMCAKAMVAAAAARMPDGQFG